MNHTEQLRLLANPFFLANETSSNTTKSQDNFNDQLNLLIQSKYNNIYISPKFIDKIIQYIHQEINEMMNHRIIKQCLDDCIDTIIKKKFDFIIPFE